LPHDQEQIYKSLKELVKMPAETLNAEQFIVVVIQQDASSRWYAVFPLLLIVVTFLLAAVFEYHGTMEIHTPLIAGLVILAIATGLAFAVKDHTPLQHQVILALFSLGGSAFATDAITGALDIKLTLGEKTAITASGALAVFVVLYFFAAQKPKG